MSDKLGGAGGFTQNQEAGNVYEAPKLTPLGNARELLAGADGSIPDSFPVGELVTQPTGAGP